MSCPPALAWFGSGCHGQLGMKPTNGGCLFLLPFKSAWKRSIICSFAIAQSSIFIFLQAMLLEPRMFYCLSLTECLPGWIDVGKTCFLPSSGDFPLAARSSDFLPLASSPWYKHLVAWKHYNVFDVLFLLPVHLQPRLKSLKSRHLDWTFLPPPSLNSAANMLSKEEPKRDSTEMVSLKRAMIPLLGGGTPNR